MSTLVLSRLVLSVLAPILLVVDTPEPLLMVKLVGSISHSPLLPSAARVDTLAVSAMCTRAALVSMKPWVLLTALDVSSLPLSDTLPFCLSPNNRMRPPGDVMLPGLLTLPAIKVA